VLESPQRISKLVLEKGLDSSTAFTILSIDIVEMNLGENIGARLRADQAESDKKIAQAEGYLDQIGDEMSNLERALLAEKTDDFARSHDFVKRELKKEIAAKLFGTRARVEATLHDDPVFQEALQVMHNPTRYHQLLAVATKKP